MTLHTAPFVDPTRRSMRDGHDHETAPSHGTRPGSEAMFYVHR